jgi:hypothetical protein
MTATRGSRCAGRQDEKSPRSAAASITTARGIPARRVPPGISPAPYTRHDGGLRWCGTLIAYSDVSLESAVHGPSFPAAAILPCRLQCLPASSRLLQVMHLVAGANNRSAKAMRIAQKESRAMHAICITMSRVNKIRHMSQKKMHASHHDARSVTCMPQFYALQRAFSISKKMMKASGN